MSHDRDKFHVCPRCLKWSTLLKKTWPPPRTTWIKIFGQQCQQDDLSERGMSFIPGRREREKYVIFFEKSLTKYFNECISWTFSSSRSICCITTCLDLFFLLFTCSGQPRGEYKMYGIGSYLIHTSKKGVRGEFSLRQSLLNTLTLPRKKEKTSNNKDLPTCPAWLWIWSVCWSVNIVYPSLFITHV